ncbi:hypothetical protein [Deinococcus wulumuqiensis]|nr:hypothetical protein [Deinococcus wulumuqiensis]
MERVGDVLVASRRQGEYVIQVGRNLEPLEHLLRRYAPLIPL